MPSRLNLETPPKPVEVMGFMLGYIDGNTFVIMDVFALPVQGFETRVGLDEKGIMTNNSNIM